MDAGLRNLKEFGILLMAVDNLTNNGPLRAMDALLQRAKAKISRASKGI